MNTGHLKIGEIGEEIACRFIEDNGYRVLKRNYRKNYGEIDVIARSKERTLVFIEVKTVRGDGINGITPEDNLTKSKLRKLSKTAAMFSAKHPELINERAGWRIDLVAIALSNPEAVYHYLTDYTKYCVIRHYENI